MDKNVRIARELIAVAKGLISGSGKAASFSATPAKNKILELCEDGVLSWETVARECIAEMSEDDVSEMCSMLDIDVDD